MPSGKEHSSTRTPPPAQPTGGSPQVNTLIVLVGTIQELRGSVPPVRGWQWSEPGHRSVRKLPAPEGHPGPHTSSRSTV